MPDGPASDKPAAFPPHEAEQTLGTRGEEPGTDALPLLPDATADNSAPVHRGPPGSTPSPKTQLSTVGLLAVLNGVLAGIGTVYLTTHSALVTLLAALSAVVLGGLAMIAR